MPLGRGPEFCREVRSVRTEKDRQRLQGVGPDLLGVTSQVVDGNHQRTDNGVERVTVQVVGDLGDGFVHHAQSVFRGSGGHARCGRLRVHALNLAQEIVDTADALGVPRLVLRERPQKHFVATEGVRAVAFDEVVGRLDVVLRLGHFLDLVPAGVAAVFVQNELRIGEFGAPSSEAVKVQFVALHQVDVHVQALGAVGFALGGRHEGVGALHAVHKAGAAQDHALVDHELERLVESDVSEVVQEFGPKPRVQQVPCGVFGAPHVEVHLAPVVAFLSSAKLLVVVGVHVAQEVPAAAGPTGHGVGFHGLAAEHGPVFALGTGQGRFPVFRGQVGVDLGQGHGGVCDALGDAVFVGDGEGFAPVALAAEHGVADAVVDFSGAATRSFDPVQSQWDGVAGAHAIPRVAVAQRGALVGACGFVGVGAFKNGRNGQFEVGGEAPVALVASGHGHDGTRAVSGKDVVGDPHGDEGAGEGMDDVPSREDP